MAKTKQTKDPVLKQVNKYIKAKEPVYIYHNDEAGDVLFAVAVKSDPGFWLNSFKTKREALNFIKKNKLPADKEVKVYLGMDNRIRLGLKNTRG